MVACFCSEAIAGAFDAGSCTSKGMPSFRAAATPPASRPPVSLMSCFRSFSNAVSTVHGFFDVGRQYP